jgi:UDP-N-acetylmuramate--alanine ligase
MPTFGSAFCVGAQETLIFEACEYMDSFLDFYPTTAVILNTELDHVDYFENLERMCRSYAAFGSKVGQDGTVIYNADDSVCAATVQACEGRRVSFGIEADADYRAADIRTEGGRQSFSLYVRGQNKGRISLKVPGRHNVYNALAAAAAAAEQGICTRTIAKGLERFGGVHRRMEYKAMIGGAAVYDDYAHHPDEIVATLQTAREMLNGTGRLVVAFQPHTYTRTAALWEAFCVALRMADRVLLADIYAAREMPIPGVDSKRLAVAVGEKATYHSNLSAMAAVLSRELGSDDLLLVMGAGDIDGIFGEFSRKDFTI